MMFCSACDNTIKNCVCTDIDERMKELTGPKGFLIAKWCVLCDKHYDRCQCSIPNYMARTDGKMVPLPEEK